MRRVSSNGVIDASAARRSLSAVELISGENSPTDVSGSKVGWVPSNSTKISCSKMGWVPSNNTKSVTEFQPDSHSIHDLSLCPEDVCAEKLKDLAPLIEHGFVAPSKVASSPVADTIVNIAPSAANLCLFQGMYNSIRTSQYRTAFSAGMPTYPTLAFLHLLHHSGDFPEKFKRGYNHKDIGEYLHFLLSHHYIAGYTWKRLHACDWASFYNSFLVPSEHMLDCAYVLFGCSPTGVMKAAIETRFKTLKTSEQIHYYLDLKASCTHASVIHVDRSDHSAYIYDSGRRSRRPFTIKELSMTVVSVDRVYLFSFTI